MRELGASLAEQLRAGDLIVLSGELGAGKTTFTQGIGAGLQVRGDVTSPTFVIAREHPSLVEGPALVHVDAYRLGGIDELDDLDLDTSLDDSVTVVEWGEGVAEGLAESRLEVRIIRALADEEEYADLDPRRVLMTPIGPRWYEMEVPSTHRPPLAEKLNENLLLDFFPCAEDELADLDPRIPLPLSLMVAEHGGRVLLVHNAWRREWELPGGLIREGETPREAAVREFREETGTPAGDVEFVGVGTVQLGHERRIEYTAVFRTRLDEVGDAPHQRRDRPAASGGTCTPTSPGSPPSTPTSPSSPSADQVAAAARALRALAPRTSVTSTSAVACWAARLASWRAARLRHRHPARHRRPPRRQRRAGRAALERPMKHGEQLAPLIERVMAEAGVVRQDLTAIAVGVGPGPFTGLRVGLVTARTLGFVLEIPVYGVCSLDVLAVEAVDTGAVATPFVVATDARRKEVYLATYDERGTAPGRPARGQAGRARHRRPGRRRGRAALPRRLPARRRPGRARRRLAGPHGGRGAGRAARPGAALPAPTRRGRPRHPEAGLVIRPAAPGGRRRHRRARAREPRRRRLVRGAGRGGGRRRAADGDTTSWPRRRRRSSGTPSRAWWPTSPSCSGSRWTPRTGAPGWRPRCSRAC